MPDLPPNAEKVQAALLDLVRAPRGELGESICRFLRSAAEGLNVARAGLWLYAEAGASLVESHRYELDARVCGEPRTVLRAADYPRYFAAIETGAIVAAADALNDERTSEFADGYLRPQAISSLLDVPIWRNGRLAGVLCLEPVGARRDWAPEEQLFAGGVGAMITLAIEVDARRSAEQAAVARERELREILDQMVDMVVITDRQGALTFLNKAGLRMIGVSDGGVPPTREQLRSLSRLQLPDGRELPAAETPLARALQGTTVHDALLSAVKPETSERIFIRTSASPVYDEAGRIAGAVAVTRDVTRLFELDQMKDQFLRVSAHELRTPVSIIRGYAQLMERRMSEGRPIDAALVQTVLQGSDRLMRLVNDLLEALHYQSDMRSLAFEFGTVDLAALVNEAARDISVTAKHPRFVVRNAGDKVTVTGDLHRLRQVLIVLFDNAVKYSPDGKPIEVELRREGGEAVIEVTDAGVGIPPEKRARIFDIFYRAHTDTPNDFGGLGVGLYLARQIIKRHGGEIGYTPRQPGSTFWVRLPAA